METNNLYYMSISNNHGCKKKFNQNKKIEYLWFISKILFNLYLKSQNVHQKQNIFLQLTILKKQSTKEFLRQYSKVLVEIIS